MFQAVFRSLAARRARRDDEISQKTVAAQLTQRASLMKCDDEQLAVRLRLIAETFQLYDGFSSAKGYKASKQLSDGLEILQQRIWLDGLDQHPVLAPIVRELAALPYIDERKARAKVAAVINATRENPWRALVDAPKRADHPAP